MGKVEELLQEMILDRYGSILKFSEATNIPKTTLYRVLGRGLNTNSVDVFLKIFAELNLDPDAYAGGLIREKSDDPEYVDVPLVMSVSAGTLMTLADAPWDDKFPIPAKLHEKYPEALLVKVNGRSQDRVFPDGSYALINPAVELKDGDIGLVVVNGDEGALKEVEFLENGIRLKPNSSDPTKTVETYDYADEYCPEIIIKGKAVWGTMPFDYIEPFK